MNNSKIYESLGLNTKTLYVKKFIILHISFSLTLNMRAFSIDSFKTHAYDEYVHQPVYMSALQGPGPTVHHEFCVSASKYH